MAPATERELIRKIDEALAAEWTGRQLWYWPAGPRGRTEASAVIVERDGRIRPVTLATLAAEFDGDRSDGETGQRGGQSCAPTVPSRPGCKSCEIARD
jgi:hypothetical protein